MSITSASPELELDDRWERLGRLWDRATGGSDVAARPSDDQGFWPTGPRPAGVSELILWLKEGLTGDFAPRLGFLVGGPGGGKSHAAAALVAGLHIAADAPDGLAHRAYRYSSPSGQRLLVINDATITVTEAPNTELGREIITSLNRRDHMLACVNRGVLVEERAALRTSEGNDLAFAVLSWLAGAAPSEEQGLLPLTGGDLGAVRRCHLSDSSGAPVAELMAVYVDACSLLEQRPGSVGIAGHPVGYRVTRLLSRSEMEHDRVPIASLLRDSLRQLPQEAAFPVDPVAANIAALSKEPVAASVLTVLRAAEIVSGTRMTYRDWWGVFSRLVVGDLPALVPSDQAAEWLYQQQAISGGSVQDTFARIKRLAGLRFSQGIFGAGPVAPVTGDPVTRLLRGVDPSQDAVAGIWQCTKESGWATPVMEALSAPGKAESPLDLLRQSLPAEDLFHLVVEPFELELDAAFVALVQSAELRPSELASATSWYGVYLSRLYALANGIPAFVREVAEWTEAWHVSPQVPHHLQERLLTLIRPARVVTGVPAAAYIPVYDSRTTPIVGAVADAQLALELPPLTLKTSRQGDSLMLSVMEAHDAVAEVELDFPLIREAMACSSQHAGATERTETTTPRLERIRSARLSPSQLHNAQYVVIAKDGTDAVGVNI